jgi:hypothetical protein
MGTKTCTREEGVKQQEEREREREREGSTDYATND